MKLVDTNKLLEGSILAQPLYNEIGRVLLHENVKLTKRMIDKLKVLEIVSVYILEEHEKDVSNQDPEHELSFANDVEFIEKCFKEIQQGSQIYRQISLYKVAPTLKILITKIYTKLLKDKNLLNVIVKTCENDQYTFVHSLNVTVYSLALGIEFGLNSEQLELLGLSAVLHDVGKMLIPNEIITKPGKLTDNEYDEIKRHTNLGYDLLKNISNIPYIVPICAYQHHERLDGSGYPQGLQSENIHLYAKIIGIADVYDAVTSDRVYKKGVMPNEALEILYTGADTLYDSQMVSLFRKVVVLYPNGTVVNTSDNREGIVVLQNAGLGDRPVIRIVKENEKEIKYPYLLDLKEENNVLIKNYKNF